MDPYRSTAREARYTEIETEWVPVPSVRSPLPSSLLDLDPQVNRHVPSPERHNDI